MKTQDVMKLRRIRRVIAFLPVAFAIGLLGANALDYWRYHAAIRRMESLTDEQYRGLAAAAARVNKIERVDVAEDFSALRPLSVTLAPGGSDFLLYQLRPTRPRHQDDEIYLYARISTSPSNQEIIYFTNSEGRQRTKVIWNSNPKFVTKHAPHGRLLTITQWAGASRSWILLRDQLLVIDNNGRSGAEPAIVGSVTLTEEQRRLLDEQIKNLPSKFLGKDVRADRVMDGIQLDIKFSEDGRDGPNDINISNTWVEELRPLLTTVSDLSPTDLPITFIRDMTTDEHLKDYPATVRTLQEWDAIYWRGSEANPPWWCVWRKWWR